MRRMGYNGKFWMKSSILKWILGLIIAVGILALAVLALNAAVLGLIIQEPERFLCDVTSCPLSLPQKSIGFVAEESLNQCFSNCTECFARKPQTSPPTPEPEQGSCRVSCVCCENYQRCLDLGGSVESCVENLKECKATPPPRGGFGVPFPICDKVGRFFQTTAPHLAAPLVQACIDMGAQVTLPPTGGCCRNATNFCGGGLTSFECPGLLSPDGIYGGDGTTCPTSPCT